MKIRTLGHFLWLSNVLLLLGACSKVPEIPPLSKDAKIVAFGDELTAAPHLPKEQGFVGLLQTQLERTVINAGVEREKLRAATQRLPQVLDKEKPELLILMHGGYRLTDDDDAANVIDLFRMMINAAQQRNVQVLLVGMPENGPHLSPPKFYRKLSSAFDIPYHGGVLSKILATPALLSPNGLPNPEGYQIMADGVIDLLQKAKAIPEPE